MNLEKLHIPFKKLAETFNRQNLPFWQNQKISGKCLMGISGGADSIFLFFFLFWLYENYSADSAKNSLIALHCRHGIRESDYHDRDFVQSICSEFDIPFFSTNLNVTAQKNKKESLEMASRRLRHGFFQKELVSKKMERIALGHHGDDQLETMLIRLGGGTAPFGLMGMKSFSNNLWRPLLVLSRDDIRSNLNKVGVSWLDDESNEDQRFLRNRVRRIVANLKQTFPRIIGNAYHLTNLLQRDLESLQISADRWIDENVFYVKNKNFYLFSFSLWNFLDQSKRLRILNTLALKMNPNFLNRNFFIKIEERISAFKQRALTQDNPFPLDPPERLLQQLAKKEPIRQYHLYTDKYRKIQLERYDFYTGTSKCTKKKQMRILEKKVFSNHWFFSISPEKPAVRKPGAEKNPEKPFLKQRKIWLKKKTVSPKEVEFFSNKKQPFLYRDRITIKIIQKQFKMNNDKDFNKDNSLAPFTNGLEIGFPDVNQSKQDETFIIEDQNKRLLKKNLAKIQKETLPPHLRGLLPLLKWNNTILALLFPLLKGITRPIRYSPILHNRWKVDLEIQF